MRDPRLLPDAPSAALAAARSQVRELLARYDRLGREEFRGKNRVLRQIQKALTSQRSIEEASFHPAVFPHSSRSQGARRPFYPTLRDERIRSEEDRNPRQSLGSVEGSNGREASEFYNWEIGSDGREPVEAAIFRSLSSAPV